MKDTEIIQAQTEEAVIGQIILESPAFPRIANILTADDFTNPDFRLIFNHAEELFRENRPIELITLNSRIGRKEILLVMMDAMGRVSQSCNLEAHALILVENTLKRSIPAFCAQITRINDSDPAEALWEGLRGFNAMVARMRAKSATKLVPDVMELLNDFAKKAQNKENGITAGIPTGIDKIDQMTGGLFPGDLILIGGRPGQFKTGLSVAIMYNLAKYGNPVAMISMDMRLEDVRNRFLSLESGIPYGRIRKMELFPGELIKLTDTIKSIEQLPIYIDDRAGIDCYDLLATAKNMVEKFGIKVLVIDYIQQIKGQKGEKIIDRVANASNMAKEIARECKIAVIALCQLNREVEKQEQSKPGMHNLKETSTLEQDADGIFMVWRPEYYGIDFVNVDGTDISTEKKLWILQEKYRHGEAGIEYPIYCDVSVNQVGDNWEPQNFPMGENTRSIHSPIRNFSEPTKNEDFTNGDMPF